MSNSPLGDRSVWRGVKHGPWYRAAGALKMRRIEQLPLRPRYTGRTVVEAVIALARLMSEDRLARALLCGGVPVTALGEMDALAVGLVGGV